MPWASASGSAASSALIRTGRTVARGANPAMPMPLPESAPAPPEPAMTPATEVPCESADRSTRPSAAWWVTSVPGRTRPARSGWRAFTPVSITATVTPAPWLSRQTREALKCCASSGHSAASGVGGAAS